MKRQASIWTKLQLPEAVHAKAKAKAALGKVPLKRWLLDVIQKAVSNR